MSETRPRTQVVRMRPFNALLITAITWAIAAGGVAAALVLLLNTEDDDLVYWGAVGAAGALAAVTALVRVKFEIDPYEVRVFNVLRTFRVPWTSVARIDTVGFWLSPGTIIVGAQAVRIRTPDGRRVVIDASNCETAGILKAIADGKSRARLPRS